MNRKFIIGGFALITALTGCQKDLNNQLTAIKDASSSDASVSPGIFKPGEILVKFKRGTAQSSRNNVLSLINGTISKQVLSQAMIRYGDKEGFFIVKTNTGIADALQKLKGLPQLEYAEPNFLYTHDAVSDDPLFTGGQLWGMYSPTSSPANEFGSRAADAWANGHKGSTDVFVGIVDEGVMYNHEDLLKNMPASPYEVADGIDNDGNGYVDDIHGWDFYDNDSSTFDGTVDDHGTHVAGTIGAVGGNGKGVVGVNWRVIMITAKFLGPSNGSTSDAVLAIDYMIDLKKRHNLKLVALNCSWGGSGYSTPLKDAIDRADSANILVVAAAGNYTSDNDVKPYYPASYTSDNIISVTSITNTGDLSYFSNYGKTSVDIAAPGSGIYSTLPGADNTSAYGSYSGTSMATPHVTGAAALYASTHLNATFIRIKNQILQAGIPTPSVKKKCVTSDRLSVSSF